MRIHPASSIPHQHQNLFPIQPYQKWGCRDVHQIDQSAKSVDILIASEHLTQQILISFPNDRRCRLRICQRTNWASYMDLRAMLG
ncbi:hypothetical protein BDQ94DRAFT_155966 [Aspergillus welwitschiae]|uniref:Uncharacterized protein n=1 Tax=Aspergillus welwitschiae TaxID=1341132 RepID=A0A3F3PGT7_9EURO|nr:hypothetical protein BDQ94DRAFT_155966 [Aspergillus welwitschiae]RDH26134.1 hypothetical protein BDQ94DRAFT_155966 [Aspergillus welwitschiae]